VSSETFTFGPLLFFLVFLAITVVIPHIHAIVLVPTPIVVLDKVIALETVAYDLFVLLFRYGVVNRIVIRLLQGFISGLLQGFHAQTTKISPSIA
jgi:hypothetical protein